MVFKKKQKAWNKGLKGFRHLGSFQKGHRGYNKGLKDESKWEEGICMGCKQKFEFYKSRPMKFCCKGCVDLAKKGLYIGDKNPNYNGGSIDKSTGYKRIYINRKRIFEHQYIWTQHNKIPIPQGNVIHHINKNKLDNRIENLDCIPLRDHIKLHKEE